MMKQQRGLTIIQTMAIVALLGLVLTFITQKVMVYFDSDLNQFESRLEQVATVSNGSVASQDAKKL